MGPRMRCTYMRSVFNGTPLVFYLRVSYTRWFAVARTAPLEFGARRSIQVWASAFSALNRFSGSSTSRCLRVSYTRGVADGVHLYQWIL